MLTLCDVRVFSAAFLVLGLSILTTYGVQALAALEAWSLALLLLFVLLFFVVILTIWRQPQNQHKVAFMVCVVRVRDAKYGARVPLDISFYHFF